MGWKDAPEIASAKRPAWMDAPEVDAKPAAAPAPAKMGIRGEGYDQAMNYSGANAVGGAVRGAGSIGATVMRVLPNALGGDTAQENAQRRTDMDSSLKSLGADPESLPYQSLKLGAELAGTSAVGGVAGNAIARLAGLAGMGAKAAPLARALQSSGMTTGGGMNALKDIAVRTGAGATVGGISAGMVDPNDSGTGALIGGALPGGLKLAGWLGGKIGDAAQGTWSAFSKQAAQKSAAGKLSEALAPGDIQKLTKTGEVPLSAAALTQNPTVARMEQASRIRSPEAWYNFDQGQGKAVFDKVMNATDEAGQLGQRSANRAANWTANWGDVEKAVDPTIFNSRIPKFQQDIDTALMSSESVNPAVRGMLDSIKAEIARTGNNFSPAHLQQIRANLSGKYNPMSPNAFASAPRDSKAVKDVLKEVDDILNSSTGGVWSKVPAAYKADSNLLHQAKAASKVRGSFMDAETGRIRGVSLDPSGDIPKITEAGLGRAMDASRMPVTNKLALSARAEGDLAATLEALRNQNIVQGLKRSSTAGGGSDSISNAASLIPGGMTKNILQQVVGAIKNAGSNKTEIQLAELLSDPSRAADVLKDLLAKKPNALQALFNNPQTVQTLYRAAPVTSAQ